MNDRTTINILSNNTVSIDADALVKIALAIALLLIL